MSARIACVGECMIELREASDGGLTRGYGGDTLNTAVYLARLGAVVDYVTALGDDLEQTRRRAREGAAHLADGRWVH